VQAGGLHSANKQNLEPWCFFTASNDTPVTARDMAENTDRSR